MISLTNITTVPYIYIKRHEKNQDIIAKEMGLIKQGATKNVIITYIK